MVMKKVYHRLDIYLPQTEKQTYPVVIVIYGSAWFSNNLKEMAFSSLGKSSCLMQDLLL